VSLAPVRNLENTCSHRLTSQGIHTMTSRNCIFGIFIFLQFCAIIDAGMYKGFGENTTRFMKQWAREVAELHGEMLSNCSCPPDSPIDEPHQFCGYEMMKKSSSVNSCKDQAIYRCMDPHPWMGIQAKDCTKLKDENGKFLPIHKCGHVPSGKAPTARRCLPIK
jgi:hypothetical protein